VTNFLIGYPDIPASASTITSSHTASTTYPRTNLITGGRGAWSELASTTADDTYIQFDLGAATTKSAQYLALLRAKVLQRYYGNKVKLTGSTASCFTPTSITGCKLWLDATRGITKDGSNKVSAWADQSGLGNNASQGSAGNQPTWVAPTSGTNGNAHILFASASTEYMTANGAATPFSGSDKAFTLSAVFKKTTNVGTQNLFVLGRASSTTPVHQIYTNASSNYATFRRDDASASASTNGGTPDTSTHVLTVVFSGTTFSAWIDGANIINAAALNVGTATLDTLGIGAWSSTSVLQPFDGRICEIVVHDTALGTSDRQSMEAYLTSKWITASSVSDTAFDTNTLLCPGAEDYAYSFSASTAYRYWWLQLGASAASKYPVGKTYFGSWFDFGREPVYDYTRGRSVYDPSARATRWRYTLTWQGITDAKLASFSSLVLKNKDINPVVLYDPANYVLDGFTMLHGHIKTHVIQPTSVNTNTVQCTFEELI